MRRFITVFAILAIGALAACSSGSDAAPEASGDGSSDSTGAGTTSADGTSADGASSQETAADLAVPPAPEYYALNVLTPVAAPGDSVTIEADGEPSTALRLIGTDGVELEASWSGSRATIDLPASLGAGLYLLQIEGQPSFATLRVVDAGSLYLATERSSIPSQEGVTLRVSSTVPMDDLIAWLVVETDELGFGGMPVENYFSPTSSGALVALEPKPLAEFVDRPLRLPSGVVGSMRIMAGTEETFLEELGVDEYESNSITIGHCDAGSMVTGVTSGPALVRTLCVERTLQSEVVVADGDYWIEAGAGPVLVSVMSLESDGAPTPEYFAVNAPCEDSVAVGAGVAAGPATDAVSDLGKPVAPSVSGGSKAVCRTVFVGAIKIEGQEGDWGPYVAAEIAQGLPDTTVISEWDADQVTAFEALRQALDAGDDELIERLGQVVGSADFVVTGRIRDQLGEASVGLISRHRRETDLDASGSWSGGAMETALLDHAIPELIENMRTSAICGGIAPPESSIESDEEVELSYTLTDLAGGSVDGASVSVTEPSLGTLDPTSGSSEGGEFVTTFTPNDGASGSQGLEFRAEWDGPGGTVRTREDESWATILIDADWLIHMEATEVQADLGADGYTRFTWDGEFTTNAEGVIEGSGTGTVEMGGSCFVDGVAVEGPFRIPGEFSFDISGERTYSATPDFVFGFTGTHFQIDEIQPMPVSGPCLLLGALGQGLGGEVMRVIAHHPQLMPIDSEGSLVLPAVAGTTSFETWSGPPFTVTLDGVVYD